MNILEADRRIEADAEIERLRAELDELRAASRAVVDAWLADELTVGQFRRVQDALARPGARQEEQADG